MPKLGNLPSSAKDGLLIHGDNCMNTPAAKRDFDSIPTSKTKLMCNNGVSHFHHYEQPYCVDQNV